MDETTNNELPLPPGVPSPKQQQWGVFISIIVIVLMIIIGAFYAWGQRIAQNATPSVDTMPVETATTTAQWLIH